MKKPACKSSDPGLSFTCSDETFSKKFPALTEMMCDGFWEDGSPRELCRLSISFGGGTVTLGLSDENFRQSMYTDGQSVDAALKLMNAAIAAGTASWRPWKAQGKKKA